MQPSFSSRLPKRSTTMAIVTNGILLGSQMNYGMLSHMGYNDRNMQRAVNPNVP